MKTKSRWIHIDFGRFRSEQEVRSLGDKVLKGTDNRNIGASYSVEFKGENERRLRVGCMSEDVVAVVEVVLAIIERHERRRQEKKVAA